MLKKIQNFLFCFKKSNSITNINHTSSTKILELQTQIDTWKKNANEIQSSFDFDIPNYILDELIKKRNILNSNYDNIYYLLNCAVMNGKLTRANANKIKEVYEI